MEKSKKETFVESDFQGITVCYEEKIVRITCNETLARYLDSPGNGSVPLAEHIRAAYQKYFGRQLEISLHSLAVEILGHVYADRLGSVLASLSDHFADEQNTVLTRLALRLKERTEVIDCGEKDVDGNRFIWDMLEPFHGVIYLLLGKKC